MLDIKKVHHCVVLTPTATVFDKIVADTIERTVASHFSREGIIDYILDLEQVSELSEHAMKVFDKINKLVDRESGIFALVAEDESIAEYIATHDGLHYSTFITLDDALDFVLTDKDDDDDEEYYDDDEENDY